MPLTGAFQATFPAYRQRSSFGRLGDATQLTDGSSKGVKNAIIMALNIDLALTLKYSVFKQIWRFVLNIAL